MLLQSIATREVGAKPCTALQVVPAASVKVPLSLARASRPPVYQATGAIAPQVSTVASETAPRSAEKSANVSSEITRTALGASAVITGIASAGSGAASGWTLLVAQAASTLAAIAALIVIVVSAVFASRKQDSSRRVRAGLVT